VVDLGGRGAARTQACSRGIAAIVAIPPRHLRPQGRRGAIVDSTARRPIALRSAAPRSPSEGAVGPSQGVRLARTRLSVIIVWGDCQEAARGHGGTARDGRSHRPRIDHPGVGGGLWTASVGGNAWQT